MIAAPGLVDALLKTASDAIIATDRAGTINFWNPGADRIFGFTADEAIGRSLDLIIPAISKRATGPVSIASWRRAKVTTARATFCRCPR